MAVPMKIDFVSDISCPWCVVGLGGLEIALERIGDEIVAAITFQPFELNPNMSAFGQNIVEHIGEKYGSTPTQSATNRAMIRDRAADIGLTMADRRQSNLQHLRCAPTAALGRTQRTSGSAQEDAVRGIFHRWEESSRPGGSGGCRARGRSRSSRSARDSEHGSLRN